MYVRKPIENGFPLSSSTSSGARSAPAAANASSPITDRNLKTAFHIIAFPLYGTVILVRSAR